MELTGILSLVWSVIFVNIILPDLVHSLRFNYSLGFLSPLDKSLGPISELGKELVSAYKLAVEAVNRDAASKKSGIRFSTQFSNLIKDETSNPSHSCKKITESFHADNQLIGIVGAYSPACSISTQKQIVTSGSNLSQISYGSTIPELSDKIKYPRLFRTCSSDISQAQALADLVHHFGWRKVGVIGSDDSYGKGIIENFLVRANNHGILIKERGKFMPDDHASVIQDQLQKLKNTGTRINIVVADGKKLFEIFREAANKKMTGEGWVWIGSDRSSAIWLGEDALVKDAAKGLVSLAPIMPSGSKLLEVIMEWFGHGKEYPGIIWKSSEPSVSPYVAEVFDAVFAYYHALTALIKAGSITKDTSIGAARQLVFEQLKTFKDEASGFEGLAGNPVYFDVDGNTLDAPGRYDILNFKGTHYIPVGNWSESSTGIRLPSGLITWPGGSKVPPTDRGSPGKPLFKIGFLSPTNRQLGTLSKLGIELLSAFQVAVSIVNGGKDYNIEIDMKIYDEGADGQKSCEDVAYDLIHDNVAAVVGAYRSQCSLVLSRILGSANHGIPIVSYGSSSPELSNKTAHKYFFRVIPSATYQAEALMRLIKKYDFRENETSWIIGTIFTNNLQSKELASHLHQEIANKSIPFAIRAEIKHNADAFAMRKAIQKVKDSGSHVNMVLSMAQDAEAIYQQFKELSMIGKGWVTFADCDATATSFSGNSELAKALHGLVGIAPKAGEGHLYLQFLSTWLSKDQTLFPGIVHTQTVPKSMPFTTQVFDAVSGIASALSDLILKKSIGYNTHIKTVRARLYERLTQYSDLANGFPSASGLGAIFFDKNQDGPAVFDVVNLVESSWKSIGTYSGIKRQLSLSQDPIFPGGLTIPIVGSGKAMYKIAGIFPKHAGLGPLADLGSVWEKAFKVGTTFINRNQSRQTGFHYLTYDGGLDEWSCARVAKAIPDDVHLVIGEARSACTRALYLNLRDRGIPVMTYGSSPSLLDDKSMYPHLFRMNAKDKHQATALDKLIEKFHWDKIGIIASDNTYGTGMSGHLKTALEENSVRIVQVQKFSVNERMKTTVELSSLKDAGAGVNIVISPTSDAERVFQEAFELGMTGKGWTWLGSDGATSTTFAKSHHLQIAMQGMVGFGPKRGRTPLFDAIMKSWDPSLSSKKKQIPYVAQIFDAVLAASLAFERLHKRKLVSETTNHSQFRNSLIQELKGMDSPAMGFDSTTGGRGFFDQNQDGQPAYDLLNLNGDAWVKVGSYDADGLRITNNVIWSGGTIKTPPSDPPSKGSTPINSTRKSNSPDTGLVVLSVIFGIFGLLVLAFMAYIIRRVRYRHLYMQSDATSGGLFSVLYGHRQNHSFRRAQTRVVQHSNGNTLKDTELNELPEYSVPRHA